MHASLNVFPECGLCIALGMKLWHENRASLTSMWLLCWYQRFTAPPSESRAQVTWRHHAVRTGTPAAFTSLETQCETVYRCAWSRCGCPGPEERGCTPACSSGLLALCASHPVCLWCCILVPVRLRFVTAMKSLAALNALLRCLCYIFKA
jgi:hypothetical protein